jgi:RNA polymerase sigma-70 factor (ECF subfamily)
MANSRRDRNPFVNQFCWSPRQLDDLNSQRQALLDQAQAGSRKAHAALLTSYWPMMKVYFGRRLSPKLAAKENEFDLAQKAALHAWCGFERFVGRELAKYRAWLTRICERVFAALLRRFEPGSKRDLAREETLDDMTLDAGGQRAWGRRQPSPDEIVAVLEAAGQLQSAVDELPPDERQIVTLRLYGKLAFAEIARRLGMSNDAIERLYRRALGTLQRRLS